MGSFPSCVRRVIGLENLACSSGNTLFVSSASEKSKDNGTPNIGLSHSPGLIDFTPFKNPSSSLPSNHCYNAFTLLYQKLLERSFDENLSGKSKRRLLDISIILLSEAVCDIRPTMLQLPILSSSTVLILVFS